MPTPNAEQAREGWQSEDQEPTAIGWYEVERPDGTRCARVWNDLWWIPLRDGWFSGLPGGFRWRGPAVPLGADKSRSPADEAEEVAALAFRTPQPGQEG